MALHELRQEVEQAHQKLIGVYNEVKQAIEAMIPGDVGVRDEVWRLAQHALRTAMIADNLSNMIGTKIRRVEIENAWYLPDPYEGDPFGGNPGASQPLPAQDAPVGPSDTMAQALQKTEAAAQE